MHRMGIEVHSVLVRLHIEGGSAPGQPDYRCFSITLRHTTVSRTPLDEWSAWRRGLCLTTHNAYNWQTSTGRRDLKPNLSNRAAADPRRRPDSRVRINYCVYFYNTGNQL